MAGGALTSGQAGETTVSDGAQSPTRLGRLSDLIVSELNGRFYENTFRNRKFGGGLSALTGINNATFTTATLGATATPILGVWNPSASTVNLEILQAILGITITAATSTGGGPFVWAISTGNAAISTGVAPFNRKTLVSKGSQAVNVSGVALTGLTTNLALAFGSALNGGSLASFSFVGTAVGQVTPQGGTTVENFDGSLIVPPGGVLALLATTTPVAHSAVGSILWDEMLIN